MTHASEAVVALFVILLSGCGGHDSALAPTIPTAPTAPIPTGPVVTVSGQVKDLAGHPVAARVWVFPLRWSEVWSGQLGRSGETDISGRYRLNAPLHRDTAYVRAYKDGYVQQCATAVTLDGDVDANLVMTEKASAVLSGLPRILNTRHINGTVFETDGERRPASNVWVGWEPIIDTVIADTLTDSQGRYRLCGLPTDRIDVLFALKRGTIRAIYASVQAGGDTVVDFELP